MSEYMLQVIMCTKNKGAKNFLEHVKREKIISLTSQSGSVPNGDITISQFTEILFLYQE